MSWTDIIVLSHLKCALFVRVTSESLLPLISFPSLTPSSSASSTTHFLPSSSFLGHYPLHCLGTWCIRTCHTHNSDAHYSTVVSLLPFVSSHPFILPFKQEYLSAMPDCDSLVWLFPLLRNIMGVNSSCHTHPITEFQMLLNTTQKKCEETSSDFWLLLVWQLQF